jgi:hypothetical protein
MTIGIGLVAFTVYAFVVESYLGFFWVNRTFLVYPAFTGVFFLMWGYYTLRSNPPEE